MDLTLYYGLRNCIGPLETASSLHVKDFVLQGKIFIRDGIITKKDGLLLLKTASDLSQTYPTCDTWLLLTDVDTIISTITKINTDKTIAGQTALMQDAIDSFHSPAYDQARGNLILNHVLACAKDFWESFVPK